jgi:hypothetical protein
MERPVLGMLRPVFVFQQLGIAGVPGEMVL